MDVLKLGREHGSQHTRVRRELVQPAAEETAHGRERDGDTRERRKDQSKEWIEQNRDLDGGRDGGDELAEGDTEEFDEDDHEQLEAVPVCACRTVPEAHRPHEQNPVDDGAEQRVWHLSDELTDGEHVWRVDPTGCLCIASALVQCEKTINGIVDEPRMKMRLFMIHIGSS